LFTDLENYTATVGEMDRERLHTLIEEHESKVADVLEKNKGRVVKNIGDSFMAIFDSATEGIKAALALMESLKDDPVFNVKIALATGDVEEISQDFFGTCVNLASRILAKTPSQEIWFAQSTFLSMNPSEIAWDYVESFLFKGFFIETPVYRAISKHRFCPSKEFITLSTKQNLVLYDMHGDLAAVGSNDLVVVFNTKTDEQSQRELLSQLSFIPIGRIWICAYHISPKERYTWLSRGGKWLICDTQIAYQELMLEDEDTEDFHTIIVGRKQTFLALSGLALPRTPIADVVGYRYYFNRKGKWSPISNNPLISLHISTTKVMLHIQCHGTVIQGKELSFGATIELKEDIDIAIHDYLFSYTHIADPSFWGVIDGVRECQLFVETGKRVELGREVTEPSFSLRKSRHKDNLIWADTVLADQLKKKGFTLERGLVGRKQIRLEVQDDGYFVEQLHQHCASYILEQGRCTALKVNERYPFYSHQQLILGTNVFTIFLQ